MTQAIPRIASLKNSDAFRTHLAKSGIALEFDDVLAATRGLAAWAPDRDRRPTGRQSFLHPADGRLGRHDDR